MDTRFEYKPYGVLKVHFVISLILMPMLICGVIFSAIDKHFSVFIFLLLFVMLLYVHIEAIHAMSVRYIVTNESITIYDSIHYKTGIEIHWDQFTYAYAKNDGRCGFDLILSKKRLTGGDVRKIAKKTKYPRLCYDGAYAIYFYEDTIVPDELREMIESNVPPIDTVTQWYYD